MEKIKQYKYIIIIVSSTLCLFFYWHFYEPRKIREVCINLVLNNRYSSLDNTKSEDRSFVNYMYQNCLRKSGLNQ